MYNSRVFLSYFPYTYLHSTYIHICTIMNSSLVYICTMQGLQYIAVEYSIQQNHRGVQVARRNLHYNSSSTRLYAVPLFWFLYVGSEFLGGAACTALKIQFLVFPITKHKFLRSIHPVEIFCFLSGNSHCLCIFYCRFIIIKTFV